MICEVNDKCAQPFSFWHHDAKGPLFRRANCPRAYRLVCSHLLLLGESPNQTPGSNHDCREHVVFLREFTPDGRPKVRCDLCHKIFEADQYEFILHQGYATCAH